MKQLNIDIGVTSFPVVIDVNIIETLDERLNKLGLKGNKVLIVDEIIYNLKFEAFNLVEVNKEYYTYIMPARKNNKTMYAALKIFEFLDLNNISRDSTIVAIGGGVVGDMAGFCASCWYRGINLVHIPTTLLSAVDSCVGGKTAINFRSTVNAVGSYHHPCAILIDTDLLSNLPRREISSGYGEIIKYANIGALNIREILESEPNDEFNKLDELVMLSLREKEKYVTNDIKESANRLYLNFGHTIGHAIEFSTVYNGEESLRHGEGVALGMLAIFRICIHLKHLSESKIEILKDLLNKYNLPTSIDSNDYGVTRDYLVNRILELCFKDKKRVMDELRLILIDENYKPFIHKTNDKKLIAQGIMEVIK